MFSIGLFGGRRRSFGKAAHRKTKKAPKDNWFERLTQPQLKQLLAAAQLPTSGKNAEQVARCVADACQCS